MYPRSGSTDCAQLERKLHRRLIVQKRESTWFRFKRTPDEYRRGPIPDEDRTPGLFHHTIS